jgi:hypothetical protein
MKPKYFSWPPILAAAAYFAMPTAKLAAQGQVLLPQGNFEQVEAATKPTVGN